MFVFNLLFKFKSKSLVAKVATKPDFLVKPTGRNVSRIGDCISHNFEPYFSV